MKERSTLSYGFKSKAEFEEAHRRGLLPAGIPINPDVVYKDKWRGWNDFLGISGSDASAASCRRCEVGCDDNCTCSCHAE